MELLNRRQWLAAIGAAVVGVPLVGWATRRREVTSGAFPVSRTDAEWRARLDPEAYRILRRANTERAFSSELNGNHNRGTYVCAGCDQALFSSADKFDSGTGWPSYSRVLPGAVGTRVDSSWFLIRTEVYCARCGGHLGHLFTDGPPPTGLRYCINGGALRFKGA